MTRKDVRAPARPRAGPGPGHRSCRGQASGAARVRDPEDSCHLVSALLGDRGAEQRDPAPSVDELKGEWPGIQVVSRRRPAPADAGARPGAPTLQVDGHRSHREAVGEVLESAAPDCALPAPPEPPRSRRTGRCSRKWRRPTSAINSKVYGLGDTREGLGSEVADGRSGGQHRTTSQTRRGSGRRQDSVRAGLDNNEGSATAQRTETGCSGKRPGVIRNVESTA